MDEHEFKENIIKKLKKFGELDFEYTWSNKIIQTVIDEIKESTDLKHLGRGLDHIIKELYLLTDEFEPILSLIEDQL